MKVLYKRLVDNGIINLMQNGCNLYIDDVNNSIKLKYNPDKNIYNLENDNRQITYEELLKSTVTSITGDDDIDYVPAIYITPTKKWYEKYN